MCSSCMCVLNMCFACSGLGDTHPSTRLETTYACGLYNQQFINSFALLNMYTSTNFCARWGFLFEQVFVFYWIFQGCRYCQWILFKQLVSSKIVWKSVKMLKRSTILLFSPCWVHQDMDKGYMLALCCGEIEHYFLKLDSQPTLVLLNIRNKNRAMVADDRARCNTPKNLCIVLILPLAALRITYMYTGRRYRQMQ